MSGTILIVDAVATNRLSLRMRLNKARYTVQAVHSIQEALLSQQAGSWDAVILSVETPKDIFSLSALVEKTSAPVLALTQNESAGFRMLALKAGVEDVLLKSGSIDYLLARLRCLIRMRHTRLELNVREDTNRPRVQRTRFGLAGKTQSSSISIRNPNWTGFDRKARYRQRF